jgi:hypothetical protein
MSCSVPAELPPLLRTLRSAAGPDAESPPGETRLVGGHGTVRMAPGLGLLNREHLASMGNTA